MRVRTLAAVLLTSALALAACGKEGSPTDQAAPAGLFEVAKDVKVEGSPTFDVGRHPFARLRWDDDGREILQFWSLELDSALALADRPHVFCRIDTFKVKVSIWAWLDQLDVEELTELLTDSWRARRGVRS